MKLERAIHEKVSVLMPVCNEADIIEKVIEEWADEVFRFLPEGSELLFDEAASTDETRGILTRMCAKYPFIRVTYNDCKDGFANAARRLYMAARCPWVFFTDSDGQYVAAEFWKLVPHMGEFSMIHGAKIGRQDAFFRKVSSAVFNRIARFVFDIHYSDINSAFRLSKKSLVEELIPRCQCMPTLLNAEFLIRTELENYAIKQVRIIHRARRFGSSRGLPPMRYLLESYRAYRGLLKLKSNYRQ